MPWLVLSALLIAFWIPPSDRPPPSISPSLAATLTLAGPLLIGAFAYGTGRVMARRAERPGEPTPGSRRLYGRLALVLDALILLAFALTIHRAEWPGAVRAIFGGRDPIVLDDALILAPFLLCLLACWWGLYPAERALRPARARGGLRGYLIRLARQSLGLILPAALAFDLGQDVLHRAWPESDADPSVQVALIAALGAANLLFAPALVRLSWPTRPMPAGPLRDRLERLAGRCRFRCTDILIWDTGGNLVNAGVTGALPWFRYVLVTDALVERLDEREVEAVFGHEIGHVAHRHLPYFGLFFLGSLAVMALVADAIATHLTAGSRLLAGQTDPATVQLAQATVALVCVAGYFVVVFGFLSRRFERQADVFGCRAVSCGRPACPPHADRHARPEADAAPARAIVEELCPVGIRIFANALSNVADLNGITPEAHSWRHGTIRDRIAFLALSWRHGSIRRRIAFLEGLEGHPEVERRFQTRVVLLRIALATALALAAALAVSGGALDHLR